MRRDRGRDDASSPVSPRFQSRQLACGRSGPCCRRDGGRRSKGPSERRPMSGGRVLNTWVYRIAVNEARNHRRWFRRHRRQAAGPGRGPGEPSVVLIEQALRTMPPKLRAALVLREIEGLSYRGNLEDFRCLRGHSEIADIARAGGAHKSFGWPSQSSPGSGVVHSVGGPTGQRTLCRRPPKRSIQRLGQAFACSGRVHPKAVFLPSIGGANNLYRFVWFTPNPFPRTILQCCECPAALVRDAEEGGGFRVGGRSSAVLCFAGSAGACVMGAGP